MKLPYKNRAYIPPEKIEDYLLSPTHDTGKHKARVFQSVGFNYASKELFEKALLKIAHTNDVYKIEDAENNGRFFGKKYIIIGNIVGIYGTMTVKTVWKILNNKRKPSLVTVSW